jgi:hypothetical protein
MGFEKSNNNPFLAKKRWVINYIYPAFRNGKFCWIFCHHDIHLMVNDHDIHQRFTTITIHHFTMLNDHWDPSTAQMQHISIPLTGRPLWDSGGTWRPSGND